MESCNTGDTSVDLLQSTISNKKLHRRRLAQCQASTVQTLSPTRLRRLRQAAKRHRAPKQSVMRQWGFWRWRLPLALVIMVLSLYAMDPTDSNTAARLIFPSYKTGDASAPQYGKGPWDVAFVAFYTLVLTAAREFLMDVIFRPIAVSYGLTKESKQARFFEQVYVALYTGVVGPFGMYVMYRSPTWYFSTEGMYAGYPHKTHVGVAKAYYLVQAAFWAQQALVMTLGLEKRRKDFKELVVHHVVTVSLIALSYRFHFTMVGVLVYVTHDISDFFLAAAKALNYIDNPLQGPCFALCIAFWVYLRHYINLKILYSIPTEFRTVGPYVLDWEAEQYKCNISAVVTFALLAALQGLNLYWLNCLIRNAYRFIVYGIDKDDREDDSDENKQPAVEVREGNEKRT